MFRAGLVAVVATAGFASSGAAQYTDPSGLVYGLYRKYFGNDPTPDELQYWQREMSRGMSAADVNANLLGSQKYYERNRRDPNTFIVGVYTDVLEFTPDPDSQKFWVEQLVRNHHGDRVSWAKSFLKAAHVELPKTLSNPALNVPSGDVAERLLTTSQLLASSAEAECYGESGWLIVNQARNFVDFVRANQDVIRDRSSKPNKFRDFMTNMDSGIHGIQETLSRTGLTAITTRQHLEQLNNVLHSMATNPSFAPAQLWPPTYPHGTYTPSGYNRYPTPDRPQWSDSSHPSFPEQARTERLLDEAHRNLRNTAALARAGNRYDWNTTQIQRDLDEIVTESERLQSHLRSSGPNNAFRDDVSRLVGHLRSIDGRIRSGNLDVRTTQTWYQCLQSYDSLASSLQLPTTGVRPATTTSGVNHGAVAFRSPPVVDAIDRAIGQCDVLYTAFEPYTYSQGVLRFQGDVRGLKNQLVDLRLKATRELDRSSLRSPLQTAADTLRSRVKPAWSTATDGGRNTSVPNLNELFRSFDEIERSISN